MSNTMILIVFGVVALAVIIVVNVTGGGSTTLEELSLEGDERVLFKLDGVTAEALQRPHKGVFPNALVWVTDRRILVAQSYAVQKGARVTHAIRYDGEECGFRTEGGYVVFCSSRDLIEKTEDGDIRIKPSPQSAERAQGGVLVRTDRADAFVERGLVR